jgi:site-specific recombinase XerD
MKGVSFDSYAPGAMVFPNNMGKMRTYGGFRTTFRRFVDKHRLPPEYTIHGLRHTCATMLLENKVELKVVQELLGHADSRITADIYQHVFKEVFEGAANSLEGNYARLTTVA